jgi:hypothetical protein
MIQIEKIERSYLEAHLASFSPFFSPLLLKREGQDAESIDGAHVSSYFPCHYFGKYFLVLP